MAVVRPRMVIIHGESAGMGQTTLFESLRARGLPERADFIEEDSEQSDRYPGYPAHFDRAEFAEVADRFVRHNADRFAGVGHPSAAMLETVWSQLVANAEREQLIMVSGVSFIDGAEDLDWAMASERALHEHSRRVAEIMSSLDPLLLYLHGDISVAIDRAALQPERGWLTSTSDAEAWPARRDEVVRDATARSRRIEAAFAAGDWGLTPINATSLSRGEVLEIAIDALRTNGIAVS